MIKFMFWRIVAATVVFGLVWSLTGNALQATIVALVQLALEPLLYAAWRRFSSTPQPPAVKPTVLWFTGLSGAGKTTVAKKVLERLHEQGINAAWLDGDVTREYFPKTGFSKEERDAHVLRSGFIAKMLVEHGVTVVASYISPYTEIRSKVREMCGHFVEIYVSTPLNVCEERDVKGLYARVRKGEITNFTGVDDPYEAPENPEIELRTIDQTVDESADQVLRYLYES